MLSKHTEPKQFHRDRNGGHARKHRGKDGHSTSEELCTVQRGQNENTKSREGANLNKSQMLVKSIHWIDSY